MSNRALYLFPLAIFLLSSFSGCSQSSDIHDSMVKLNAEGNFERVVELGSKELKKDSTNLDLLCQLGLALYELDSIANAFYLFEKMSYLDTNNTWSYTMQSEIYRHKGNDSMAYVLIEKAISTKGTDRIYVDLDSNIYGYDVPMEELRYRRSGLNPDLIKAYEDLSFCISKKYELSNCYYLRGLIGVNSKNLRVKGCADLFKAKNLGNILAEEEIRKYCKGEFGPNIESK